MNGRSPAYECLDLGFEYPLGSVNVTALRSLSLQIPSGAMTGLSGPSGSGKSTLLKILGLIEPLQKGRLFLHGTSLASLSERRKNTIRREELGFVFQNFVLFESLTALENVEYFLKNRPLSAKQKRDLASQALCAVGLERHLHQRPLQMSGGQRQRVAIARALAKQPKVIIADEPTASLDRQTGHEIMSLFKKLIDETGLTVVLASHDPAMMAYCHSIVYLADGQVQRIEDRFARETPCET